MNPSRYRKAFAALWGTLTVPAVVGVLALAGVHIDPETAALVIALGSVLLGTGAVLGAKPNGSAKTSSSADRMQDGSRTSPTQD